MIQKPGRIVIGGKKKKGFKKMQSDCYSETTSEDESGLVPVSQISSEGCNTALPFPVPLSTLPSIFSRFYLGYNDGSVLPQEISVFYLDMGPIFLFYLPHPVFFLLSHGMSFDLWAKFGMTAELD